MWFLTVFYRVTRTPPLTMLHLSASKFSDAPSAGGIAGFLSSDATSTQSVFSTRQSSTQPPSELKNDSTCKQPGTIQSFFQKAAEKQRQVTKDEEDDDVGATEILASPSSHKTYATDTQLETDNSCPVDSIPPFPHCKNESASQHSGISSFFHKKSLEISLQASASPLNKPAVGHRPEPVTTEDTVAAVSGLQGKHSSELTSHQLPSEESTDEPDFDPEVNYHPPNVAREDLLNCERCGQEVLVWEMPEHNDYHFALDLQNSLSSSTSSATTFSSSSTVSSSSTPRRVGVAGIAQSCRGKTKSRGQSGPQPKRHRFQGGSTGTLDSFFKRSWRHNCIFKLNKWQISDNVLMISYCALIICTNYRNVFIYLKEMFQQYFCKP